jgi:hypothetical protein
MAGSTGTFCLINLKRPRYVASGYCVGNIGLRGEEPWELAGPGRAGAEPRAGFGLLEELLGANLLQRRVQWEWTAPQLVSVGSELLGLVLCFALFAWAPGDMARQPMDPQHLLCVFRLSPCWWLWVACVTVHACRAGDHHDDRVGHVGMEKMSSAGVGVPQGWGHIRLNLVPLVV